MKYIALDIETTGLDPKQHLVLSAAFIKGDTNVYNEHPEILTIVFPVYELNDLNSMPIAVLMNKDLIKRCKATYPNCLVSRDSGMEPYTGPTTLPIDDLPKILKDFFGDIRTVAGKNVASFDMPFLYNCSDILSGIKIRRRVIDVGSLCLPLCHRDAECLPNLEDCCSLADVSYSRELAHDAQYDALKVYQIIQKLCPRVVKHLTTKNGVVEVDMTLGQD